ncbi:MAG: OmpH family outer membrane protein [Bacteriovoracaceae bacterium]
MKMLLALAVLAMSLSTFAADKIGFVDIQKIITSAKQGQNVMKSLEKAFNDKKVKLKKDEDAIKKDQEDYKKQSAVMNDAARVKKEREIQQQIFELQNKTMEAQKEINDMERDLKKPIIDRVKTIIEEVSKKAGVAMTVEVSTSPIVYAESKTDLTEEVIKIYDDRNPK